MNTATALTVHADGMQKIMCYDVLSHPRVLKEWAAELATLFQKTLQVRKIPDNWRDASVTPIYKKGNRTDATNYPPISPTSSIICKIVEKLISKALLQHMISKEILSAWFQNSRYCTTLLQVIDKWSEVLDEGGSVDVIYLDLAKAFNTVPHQRLLNKLFWVGSGRKDSYFLAGK